MTVIYMTPVVKNNKSYKTRQNHKFVGEKYYKASLPVNYHIRVHEFT